MTDDLTDVEREVSGGWAFVAWFAYVCLVVTAVALMLPALLAAAVIVLYVIEYLQGR